MGITARNWREYPQRYRLEAGKCKKCGKICFPPRLICPVCGHREFKTIKLSDEGVVKTYTIINVAPSGFEDEVPYAIGIVELKDGVSTMMQITDCSPEELFIGLPVKIEFRRVQKEGDAGILMYGYKAVPIK
jgi:uncharacterized OB-fold protein